MFENLTAKLSKTLRNITGKGKLSEENIKETLGEVRKALLDADVALDVVLEFVESIQQQAIGTEVPVGLSPGQHFVKIVNAELTKLLGEEYKALELRAQPPVVIMMAGLQGSGKTTSAAKLAKFLRERDKKKVMVTSCDVYRPAAIEQLQTLANEVGVSFFPSTPEQQPLEIAKNALSEAKKTYQDVLILDTAGRLHIDAEMMTEISSLAKHMQPTEILFVVDSMTGQDAANTAKAFDEALPLTGVVLTKTDGDARGGAALSIRQITGKPIKFLGIGEKTDALEPFHPDRIASRILGMGDVLTLVEELERKVDKDKADKLAKKITKSKGKSFDLNDLRDQLLQMSDMGGMMGIMEKLPGAAGLQEQLKKQNVDQEIKRLVFVIDSMTKKERRKPDLVKTSSSRKKRICAGSGMQVQDVNKLLKKHAQMQKMMKKFSGKGMANMLRGLQGKMPPGMFN